MTINQYNRKILADIKKNPPEKLDTIVQKIHEEVFAETDCLKCAACCKKISPIIYQHDLIRMAQALKMSLDGFCTTYLKVDKDGDYVFKSSPCPFLSSENWCEAYDARPTACRDYPHTDRRRFHQLIDLSIKNADVCPAVEKILEQLISDVGKKLAFKRR
jgi:Fe-S-cluster containining protein